MTGFFSWTTFGIFLLKQQTNLTLQIETQMMALTWQIFGFVPYTLIPPFNLVAFGSCITLYLKVLNLFGPGGPFAVLPR